MTWMYFAMQTSTMNVNCLDQHYQNCEAFGLLLPWAPLDAQKSISSPGAAAVQPGTASHSIPKLKHLPWPWQEVCASLHSPKENETKSWHCCSLRMRSLE